MTPGQSLSATGLLLLCLALPALSDPDRLVLAQNGRSSYRVVIAQEPTPQVEAVARDFVELFGRITGAVIPLATDGTPMTDHEIVIGPGRHLERLALHIDWDALGEEGYVIRTANRHLVLFGGPRGGTRNAVYTFLDEHLGCRFYSPEFTVIPMNKDLAIDPLHIEKVPVFNARNVNVVQAADPRWASRMRLNLLFRQASFWLPEDQAKKWSWTQYTSSPFLAGTWFFAGRPERIRRHYVDIHTLHEKMLLPSSLFEAHSDYFAFRDQAGLDRVRTQKKWLDFYSKDRQQ